MPLQVKTLFANSFFYREFVFPLEYKIMLNKLQKKESSALFMIIITELLILIIVIK